MKREQFSDIMNEIDDDLLLQAKPEKKKAKPWGAFAAMAACLCLVAASVAAPAILENESKVYDREAPGESAYNRIEPDINCESVPPRIINGFDSNTIACYTSPSPGSYFCYYDVTEAREYYRGENVRFLLAMDIFKDSDSFAMTDAELAAEYQRLADLGYEFYLVEDHWTYFGAGDKEYNPVIVGLFSEEQLESFDANENYGYAFRFVTNGDSSPISVDGLEPLCEFEAAMAE